MKTNVTVNASVHVSGKPKIHVKHMSESEFAFGYITVSSDISNFDILFHDLSAVESLITALNALHSDMHDFRMNALKKNQ